MTWDLVTVVGTVVLGAAGTLVRAEIAWWSTRRTGSVRRGTWLVNLAGALLLGLVVGAVDRHGLDDATATALGAGFLGGLTTFSTWMVLLVRPEAPPRARPTLRDMLVHGVGMLVAGVAAAGVGVALGGLGTA